MVLGQIIVTAVSSIFLVSSGEKDSTSNITQEMSVLRTAFIISAQYAVILFSCHFTRRLRSNVTPTKAQKIL